MFYTKNIKKLKEKYKSEGKINSKLICRIDV